LCPHCGSPALQETVAPASAIESVGSAADNHSHFAVGAMTIPGYTIQGVLGHGGMGVVYRAYHEKLKRPVALKMGLAASRLSALALARLRREAEAVARLQHPHIVQIFEIGEHEGRPFLSLEYLDGGDLGRKMARLPQPPRHAAAILEKLARAVHYAHQRGIVHRDLKPTNVLLAADGTPKVADFGLAKLLDVESTLSQTAAGMGTPSYMAPEQVWGESKVVKIGPPADVYGLGAILYEMLTGRPPFVGSSKTNTLMDVWSQEPIPPRRLQPDVPRDLEIICLKCLEKEPYRRYASAEALADDLQRFLNGKPIVAHPVGPLGKAWRWSRRNPVVAGLVAALLLVLVAGFAGVAWKWLEAEYEKDQKERQRQLAERAGLLAHQKAADEEREKNRALKAEIAAEERRKEALKAQEVAQQKAKAEEQARRELEANAYLDRISLADREWHSGNVEQANLLLSQCVPADGQRDHRAWEYDFQQRRNANVGGLTLRFTSPVRCATVSSRGLLATGTVSGEVAFWVLKKEGEPLQPVVAGKALQGEIVSLVFSLDGTQLAAISKTDTGAPSYGEVRVWHLSDIRKSKAIPVPQANGVAFHPDGHCLAFACEDGMVRVWSLEQDKEIHALRLHEEKDKASAHCVAYTQDGKQLAAGGWYGYVRMWDAQTGKPLWGRCKHHLYTKQIVIHPSGKTAASVGWERSIALWDVDSGENLRHFWGHTADVDAIALDATGRALASAGHDRTLRLFRVDTGQEQNVLRGLPHAMRSLVFHKDSDVVVAADGTPEVRFWNTTSRQDAKMLLGHEGNVFGVCFSPDSKMLASLGAGLNDLAIRTWDPRSGKAMRVFTGHESFPLDMCFNSDGMLLASISKTWPQLSDAKGKVLIWNVRTGNLEQTFGEDAGGGTSVAFSPVGPILAWAGLDKFIHVWDVKAKKELARLGPQDGMPRRLAFTPDGLRLLAAWTSDSERRDHVAIWELESKKQIGLLFAPVADRFVTAFSADRRKALLVGGRSGEESALLWDLSADRIEQSFRGHAGPLTAGAISPDGRRVATGSQNGTTKIWDVATGRQLITLEHQQAANHLSFSPNGWLLAAGVNDVTHPGRIWVWDATPHEEPATKE